ncbi:MAG: TraR/DksA family transcriptional regulator [Patescibacteria group bacterium]
MDTQLLTELKKSLENEKGKLEQELGKFAHRNPKTTTADFDANFPNLGDKEDENAAEVAAYGDNLSLESELEKQLRDVVSSLKQIDDETYGICKYCKQQISEARLLARPTSSSCIDCKKTLTQEV